MTDGGFVSPATPHASLGPINQYACSKSAESGHPFRPQKQDVDSKMSLIMRADDGSDLSEVERSTALLFFDSG